MAIPGLAVANRTSTPNVQGEQMQEQMQEWQHPSEITDANCYLEGNRRTWEYTQVKTKGTLNDM